MLVYLIKHLLEIMLILWNNNYKTYGIKGKRNSKKASLIFLNLMTMINLKLDRVGNLIENK